MEQTLTEPKVIFKHITTINKLNTVADLDAEREFLYAAGYTLKANIQQFLDEQWTKDPDVVVKDLLNCHQVNAGLIGLAEALEERAIFIYYKTYTEVAEGAKKVAQGDKKVYAEGDASDLKGLKRDFEESQRNLWERIQFFKSTRR